MPALLSNTLHPATDGAAALYSTVLYCTVLYSAVQYIATLYGEPAWAVLVCGEKLSQWKLDPLTFILLKIETRGIG